jgi:cell division protease FtsH
MRKPRHKTIFEYCAEAPARMARLEAMNAHLKGLYCGIDSVIDRVTDLMKPWYIAPGLQRRSNIICLWGMTACGKTTLVREISDFLAEERIEIDLGEYASADKRFSETFLNNYRHHSGKPVIILLDEMQTPRTISENDMEMDREGMRGLWSLLSDGIIIPNRSVRKRERIEQMEEHVAKVEEWQLEQMKKSRRRKKSTEEQEEDDYLAFNPRYSGRWAISEILDECGLGGYADKASFWTEYEKDPVAMSTRVMELTRDLPSQPILDYTKSIIFVAGNLDEVYIPAHMTDPDMDADYLHEWSKTITLPTVKSALQRRFRAEQVGRFGNNHIIYPSFRRCDFEEIIARELTTIHHQTLEEMDVDITFDPSVNDMIYKEGVFPTQGVRPVQSTMNYLPGKMLTDCFLAILTANAANPPKSTIKVEMKVDAERKVAIFESRTGDSFTMEVPIELQLESRRKMAVNDDMVMSAIHQSGHAVCIIEEVGIVPTRMSCISFGGGSDGATETHWSPKHVGDVKPYLVYDFGGICAEEVIFGTDMRSMSSRGDIKDATDLAANLICNVRYMAQRGGKDFGDDNALLDEQEVSDEIEAMTEDAYSRSLDIVCRRRRLVLSLAAELLSKRQIGDDEIAAVVERCGCGSLLGPRGKGLVELAVSEMKKEKITWSPEG